MLAEYLILLAAKIISLLEQNMYRDSHRTVWNFKYTLESTPLHSGLKVCETYAFFFLVHIRLPFETDAASLLSIPPAFFLVTISKSLAFLTLSFVLTNYSALPRPFQLLFTINRI